MQRSKIDICNMALANIGQKPIQSLDGPGISQTSCKLRYEEVRTEALCGSLWNFASLWVKGTAVSIEPKPPWTNVFLYPPDALKVFEILRSPGENKEIPFEVTARPDQVGRLIHCDRREPTFVYVKDMPDPQTYSVEFVVAMSWLLSSKIAMHITKSAKIQQDAFRMWVAYNSQARASTANEGSPEVDITASYQEVR